MASKLSQMPSYPHRLIDREVAREHRALDADGVDGPEHEGADALRRPVRIARSLQTYNRAAPSIPRPSRTESGCRAPVSAHRRLSPPIFFRDSGVGVMGQERRGGSGLAEDAGGVHGGVAEATPPAVRLNGYPIGAFGHAAAPQ